MESFTRRETQVLTRTAPSRLDYLAKTGIVTPTKVIQANRTQLYYSWDQLLEIRAINHLRQQSSLQTVRKVVSFLDACGLERSLRDKHLVVMENEVAWVMPDWAEAPRAMWVTHKSRRHVGQLVLVAMPSLINFVNELWEAAEASEIIDFERFKRRAQHRRSR